MAEAPDKDVVWHRSAVDWWFKIAFGLVVVACLAGLVASFMSGDAVGIVIVIATCIFVAALIPLLAVPVQYGIAQEELIIRFGVFRQSVRLDAIREVRPTRLPLAAPALSMDRLEIRVFNQFSPVALISPDDRQAFLAELETRAGLTRDGDRLVRANP